MTIETPKKDFDMKKALDNAKFLNFLSKGADSNDLVMTDIEAISAKFERFEKKEALLGKYKEIFGGKVKSETAGENRVGITLSEADFASVNEYFEEIALNNPEKFSKIEKTLGDFEALPGIIKTLEDAIKERGTPETLGVNREELVKEKYVVDLTGENVGMKRIQRFFDNVFKKKSPEYKKQAIAKEAFEKKYGWEKLTSDGVEGISKDLGDKIAGIDQTISDVKVLEDSVKHAQESFAKLRGELFEGMKGFSEIIEKIKDKLAQQVQELRTKETIDGQEMAGKRLGEIKKVNETGEILAGAIDEGEITVGESAIDEEIERLVTEQIATTINNMSLGNGAYSKLEKSLQAILSKETLGSKNKEDTKLFMVKALEDSIREVIDVSTNEGKQKRLMLQHIISTIK